MGIGETDWLAQEYKREGRTITPEAARRLAKEHLLDCDSHNLKADHHNDCDADELKRDSRRSAALPKGRNTAVQDVYKQSLGQLLQTLFKVK